MKIAFALVILVGWILLIAAIIRADQKDEAALQRWFDDPDHIWNQHKKENKDG